MFEHFVKRPFHLALYRNGPYAEERSRFLAHLTLSIVGNAEVIRESSATLLRARYGVRGDENARNLRRELTSSNVISRALQSPLHYFPGCVFSVARVCLGLLNISALVTLSCPRKRVVLKIKSDLLQA